MPGTSRCGRSDLRAEAPARPPLLQLRRPGAQAQQRRGQPTAFVLAALSRPAGLPREYSSAA